MPGPDPSFSVHVDPDALARDELAASVPLPAVAPRRTGGRSGAARSGARPVLGRQSDPVRAKRTATGRSRSYAFRRS